MIPARFRFFVVLLVVMMLFAICVATETLWDSVVFGVLLGWFNDRLYNWVTEPDRE